MCSSNWVPVPWHNGTMASPSLGRQSASPSHSSTTVVVMKALFTYASHS